MIPDACRRERGISDSDFITFAQGNAGLKFTPSLNSNATGHFTVQASTGNVDGGLGGATVTADITVTPDNDAPTATNLPQTKTYTEGAASVALDDIVVSDVDTSPAETITATLTLALPAAGVLTTSGTATYTPGTGVWTISGSLADVNAALAAVAFTPATNNDFDTTITTLIEDQSAAGPADGAITLDVTPVGLFGAVLVPNPADPAKTDLIVGGTRRNDRISVSPATEGGVNVVINRQRFGPFDPTGRIVVYGQAGNDKISVNSPTCLSAFLYGQAGNDTLTGGCGDDVLVGGDGKDKLLDLLGRNLLLGGRGADDLSNRRVMRRATSDNVMVAGSTDFDGHDVALIGLLAEWSRRDLPAATSYETRVNHLRGSAAGNNGTFFLDADTVHDDAVRDRLYGTVGQNWFLARTGRIGGPFDRNLLKTFDILAGQKPSELLDDI